MLQERSQHAQAVADVYMMATEIVRLLSDDHPFQVNHSVDLYHTGYCYVLHSSVPTFN